jgi:hypothetical protein
VVKKVFLCLLLTLDLWGCGEEGGAGQNNINRPCITQEQLPFLTCLSADIILPQAGLCEPLDCESETMTFIIPPGDPVLQTCQILTGCETIACEDGNLVFSDLIANPDGTVEGIITKDGLSEPFECF